MKNWLKNHLITFLSVATPLAIIAAFCLTGTLNENGSITYGGRDPIGVEEMLCEMAEKDENFAGLMSTLVVQDGGGGCAPRDPAQMGAMPYYKVDVSTPTAFYNAVNGKGFNEGWGFQCVSGFKEFMYALSGRYVATSTGGASGYAYQQSQIEPLGFTWHSGTSGMKDGDWLIFGGGKYGHVSMYYQGKSFGQNQTGPDYDAGSPFNLQSMSFGNVLGYYRPNIYQNAEPTPTPTPVEPGGGGTSGGVSGEYRVVKGDTLGGISLNQGWWPSTTGLYGDTGYAQRLADKNGIENRGLIYPGKLLYRAE